MKFKLNKKAFRSINKTLLQIRTTYLEFGKFLIIVLIVVVSISTFPIGLILYLFTDFGNNFKDKGLTKVLLWLSQIKFIDELLCEWDV